MLCLKLASFLPTLFSFTMWNQENFLLTYPKAWSRSPPLCPSFSLVGTKFLRKFVFAGAQWWAPGFCKWEIVLYFEGSNFCDCKTRVFFLLGTSFCYLRKVAYYDLIKIKTFSHFLIKLHENGKWKTCRELKLTMTQCHSVTITSCFCAEL